MATKVEQWCEAHWKVVREDQTINGILVGLLLMQTLLEDERFMKACGHNPETGQKADAALMNQKTMECSPICCFLGEEKMKELYELARMRKGEMPT